MKSLLTELTFIVSMRTRFRHASGGGGLGPNDSGCYAVRVIEVRRSLPKAAEEDLNGPFTDIKTPMGILIL